MEKHIVFELLGKEVKDFLRTIKSGDRAVVVGLYGELGSGKTTFVQRVARALGVPQPVTSPTFVIQKVYKLKNQAFDHLIHIDTYRLESSDELLHLGWSELIEDPKNLIFVEWADRVEDILPGNIVKITFEVTGEEERKVTTI